VGFRAFSDVPANGICLLYNRRYAWWTMLCFRVLIFAAFGFYAALNMVAFFMIFFLVPETKQRTLEVSSYHPRTVTI